MKNFSSFALIIPACGLTLLPFSSAQAQNMGFYLRGDAGGVVTMDTTMKEFFGEPLGGGRKVTFDPGVRFGVAAGYNVTDWFAAEAQTGLMANRVDSIAGASRVDDVFFSNVPLLANVKLQLPGNCRFTPYIGAGVGMSAAVIDADHLDIGGTTMHGSEADVVFAYQAFGGLRFKINERMFVSLEYHYFVADEPAWSADDVFGTSSDRLRFGGTHSHTATAAFTYNF